MKQGTAKPVIFQNVTLQKIQCTKCATTHPGIQIPYDDDLIAELHSIHYELTKSGQILFSHPSGTHDDRVFASH